MRRHPALTVRIGALTGAVLCALALLAAGGARAQTPEFRAYWVDAWHDGFKTPAQCDQLIADMQTSNCNVAVVQMRRRGDTYYPSAIESFAPDADPSFDSLRYLLDRCHAANPPIQVHAWLVLIPIWTSTTFPTYPHPSNLYPQFLSKTNTGSVIASFDPGHPDCEQYLNDIVMELVNNYPDLDGISYDYSRFGAQTEGYNDVSVARFNAQYNRSGIPDTSDAAWSQWRRDQMTNLIRKTYANAIAVNPNICMSSAVVTWYPSPVEAGSFENTRPYYQTFQDWRGWMQEGILDLSMPMCYFDRDGSYASCYDNWMNFAKDNQYSRGTAIGPGIYMNTIPNSIYQIRQTRDYYNGRKAAGVVMYSYASTNKSQTYPNSDFYSALSNPSVYDPNPTPVFSTSTSVPAMTWKTAPTRGHIRGHVVDCGARVDGAIVYLTGQESRSIRTDGTGFYAFIDLAPGQYTLSITHTSRTQQRDAAVTEGQVTTVDFDFCPTEPPVISEVRAENVTAYTADIKWTTDLPSSSQVEYGPTDSYGSATAIDATYVTNHFVRLTGLSAGQLYHYRVRSGSVFEAVSDDCTFTTQTDSTPPVISNVTVAAVEQDRALITWTTDDPSTSRVDYGLTTSYDQSTAEDPALVTGHSVLVTGLSPSTLYHFRAESTNELGMTSYSGDYTFTTIGPPTEVIVDDADPNCTFTQSTGYEWTIGTYPGGWPVDNSSYKFVWNRRTSTTATCTWTPNIPKAGRYDVYIWFLHGTNRTTAARYTVTHAGGTTSTMYVDQTDANISSRWHKIASDLQFNEGTSGYVTLINRTTENSQTRVIVADAVRFASLDGDDEAPASPQSLQAVAESTSQISLSWDPSTDNVGVIGYKVFRDSVQVGTSSTTTFIDSGLQTNSRYTYAVQAYDARQNHSALSSPISRYTLSAPPTQADVTCDRSPATWYNTTPFTFSNSGFGAGKVNHYGYAWDDSPGHTWTGMETVWLSSYKTFDATTASTEWYLHVRGYNGDNIPNGELDLGPFYYDGTPPSVISVTAPMYLGLRTGSWDDLTAGWVGSDGESGIAEYHYAIGTSPGAADVLDWTSAGASTTASHHYPEAPLHDYSYYFSVKAKDNAGNLGDPAVSGPSVYARVYDRLADAMANPDDTPVMLDSGKVVSANHGDCSYVQEPDRSRGLRLNCSAPWILGDLVNVAGRLATAGGERLLTAVEWSPAGSEAPPAPIAVPISALGGCAPDAYTPGVPGAWGCYNVGLLVRTWGRVVSTGAGHFTLADGSGATVKVYSAETVPDNGFVGAIGVCGLESGERVIRTSSAASVEVY